MDLLDVMIYFKGDVSDFSRSLEGVKAQASGLGGKLGSAVANGLSAMAKAGAVAIGATSTAVGGLMGAAISTGEAFDATMSKVSAISGATGDDFDALREKAIEMGGSPRFNATEAAEAMTYMGMAGWKTEQMISGIAGIMDLASASGEDLATTSDIVTDALTAFGLQAEDSSRFANVLAAAATNSNTNVGMMGETFKYFAPLAGTFKFSMEDTAVAVGLMANSGIKASQAGTALRAAFSRMAKPTKQVQEALEMLGLSVDGANLLLTKENGEMRSLSEVMDILRGKLGGLTEAEKAKTAAQLFGQEAMSGMLAIVNASEDDYRKLSDAINDAAASTEGLGGTAAEMAATMEGNLKGALTSLGSAMETMKIRISDVISPIATDFVNLGTEAVRGFTSAFADGGLMAAMESLKEPISKFVGKVSEYLPTVINAGASIVMSLLDGIVANIDVIAKGAADIAVAFVQNLIAAIPDIMTAIGTLVAGIGDAIIANKEALLGAVGDILSFLQSALIDGLPAFVESAASLMGGLAAYLVEALPNLIPAALEAVMAFSGSLRENAGLIIDGALGLILALGSGLIESLPAIIETLPTIVSNIAGIINDNAPKLIAVGVELIVKLLVGIIEAVPTLLAEFPKIVAAIIDVFTAMNWLQLGASVIEGIWGGVRSLAGSIPQALSDIGHMAMEWFRAINWASLGRDLIDLIVIGIQALVGSIPNALLSIGNAAVNAFLSIDWLGIGLQIVRGIASGILGGLGEAVENMRKVAGSILETAQRFFKIRSPSRVFRDKIGGNIVAGLVSGISRSIPDAVGAMDDMDAAIMSAAPGPLDWDAGIGPMGAARLAAVPQQLPPLLPTEGAGGGRDMTVVLELDGVQFARAVYKYYNAENRRLGVNLANGGIA